MVEIVLADGSVSRRKAASPLRTRRSARRLAPSFFARRCLIPRATSSRGSSFASSVMDSRGPRHRRAAAGGATKPPRRIRLDGGRGGKAIQRPVQAGDWLGDQWLVTSGLKNGERVVVDGFMRLAPGVRGAQSKEVAAAPLPLRHARGSDGSAPSASRRGGVLGRCCSCGARPAPRRAGPHPGGAAASRGEDECGGWWRGAQPATRTPCTSIGAGLAGRHRPHARLVAVAPHEGAARAPGRAARLRRLERRQDAQRRTGQATRQARARCTAGGQRAARAHRAGGAGQHRRRGDSPALARRVDIVLAGAR